MSGPGPAQARLIEHGFVNPALGLVPAAPTARTQVFAGLDLGRAGHAADRRIALRLQRVTRQLRLGEIGVERRLVPVGERVDLQPAFVDLEPRQRTAASLKAFASRNPGVEWREGTTQRLDLAQVAATIGIIAPAQAGLVLLGEQIRIGPIDTQVGEPQRLGNLVAIGECFTENLLGVDKDHRHRGIRRRNHVEQHRRLRAERRHRSDTALELTREQVGQHRLSRHAGVFRRQPRHVGQSERRRGVDDVGDMSARERRTSHAATPKSVPRRRRLSDIRSRTARAPVQAVRHRGPRSARSCRSRRGA